MKNQIDVTCYIYFVHYMFILAPRGAFFQNEYIHNRCEVLSVTFILMYSYAGCVAV